MSSRFDNQPIAVQQRHRAHVLKKLVMLAGGGMAFLCALTVAAGPGLAQFKEGASKVTFPEDYANGVHYTTVHRGGIREEIFVTPEAINAVKAGGTIPSGTVITLVDYRDGGIFRYVVMEKRAGWGAEYPSDIRNGEWQYQAFNADKSINQSENLDRCFSCHKSQAANDYVYTLDHMKAVD